MESPASQSTENPQIESDTGPRLISIEIRILGSVIE